MLLRALLLPALLFCGGCNIIGMAAQVLPPANVTAAYSITGQSVGVMVWVDRGIALDYPQLRSDLAKAIQTNFNEQVKAGNKDLLGTQFLDPGRVVQFQEAHPELEGLPITDVAPRLGVSRIIYVEVSSFETRSSLYLLKGSALGTIQAVEIIPGEVKTAKIAYTSSDLHSTYPSTTSEGLPASDTITLNTVYQGTVAELASDVAEKFYRHTETAQ